MGFRLHRSMKLMPGLRLNFSKSGIGLSAGPKGFSYSVSPNGRRRRTVSIPGTGLSWVDQSGGGRSSIRTSPARPPAAAASSSAPIVAKPGWLSPKADKDLAEAIADRSPERVEKVGESEPRLSLAASAVAGVLYLARNDYRSAERALGQAFSTGSDPASDPFVKKYVRIAVDVEVVEGARTALPIDRTTIGLLLGELRQQDNDIVGAIEIIEQLHPSTLAALSLAELCSLADHYDEVIKITEGVQNSDDPTALLCTFRGVAFRETGSYTAARACFADALRTKKRDPAVLHRAWWERAKCYLAEGQRSRARKDLERILADDSTYPGVQDLLNSIS